MIFSDFEENTSIFFFFVFCRFAISLHRNEEVYAGGIVMLEHVKNEIHNDMVYQG